MVAGSIPDGATGIFHRAMDLVSTQIPAEMSTITFPEEKAAGA